MRGRDRHVTVADATAKSAAQPASTTAPLTVPVGHTVEFNAGTIVYPTTEAGLQAATYAYEWAPTGGSYSIIEDIAGKFTPNTTASYQYNTPGIYPVKLKLLGDFGEYLEEGSVIVQSTNPPTASFNVPDSGQTNQAVELDATASQPASGAKIANYHWSFGDGQGETHPMQRPATRTQPRAPTP